MSNVFPKYFREKWQQKEGYDPVVAEAKRKFYQTFHQYCFLLGALVLVGAFVYTTTRSRKEAFIPVILGCLPVVGILMVLGLAMDSKADKYRKLLQRFQNSLSSVASRLGRSVEQLVDADQKTLGTIATSLLKEFGLCIKAVDKVIGNKPHQAREALKVPFKSSHECFVYWEIIPDTDWTSYFSD